MKQRKFRDFSRDEDGVVTIWSLGWLTAFLMIGGLSIDVGNAFRVRQLLQATADSAAHAGVQNLATEAAAETLALAFADANMPSANFGAVLEPANILVGTWDPATRVFTETMTDPDAVRVLTQQTSASGNPVGTFFLKLANFQKWDIATAATAQQFHRKCHLDGMIAGRQVFLRSNNHFVDNYCIHGEQGVRVSSNNAFDAGVQVTMYDLGDFEMPGSGFETNTGLQPALGENFIQPVLANKADAIVADLYDPAYVEQPDFIDANSSVNVIPKNDFDGTQLLANQVNMVVCSGNQQITINNDLTISNVVLVTNCRINIGTNTILTNSVLATSNPNGNSVMGGQDMQLGADDNCAAGGGSKIISSGGIHFASGSKIYGSHVVSGESIHIAAQGDGIQGSSFQAKLDIDQTANGGFGLCADNADVITKVISYRIVD